MREYTLLLVDDDADVRGSLRRGLAGSEFIIHETCDAVSALDVLQVVPIDVVISDFSMPGMNGLELLHQVRFLHPNVVRILLTGEFDVELAARALNEGAAHRFLLKPWNRIDLLGTVRLALRSMPRAAAPRASMRRPG